VAAVFWNPENAKLGVSLLALSVLKNVRAEFYLAGFLLSCDGDSERRKDNQQPATILLKHFGVPLSEEP
jgi:hypothetical protein